MVDEEVGERRLAGESVVADGEDDDRHLQPVKRGARDVPLPAGVRVRVRVLQAQSPAADDDGISGDIDPLDELEADLTAQRCGTGELECLPAGEAGEEIPHHREQGLVAVVAPGRDVEVEEPNGSHGQRLYGCRSVSGDDGVNSG